MSITPRALFPRVLAMLGLAAALAAPRAALAQDVAPPPQVGAYLVVDARTGEVVAHKDADRPWYPASVTKLMTAYTVFRAIREGRLRDASPVTISVAASRQQPSKMGFKPGTVITMDNAIKMIMVKSANDVSHAIAESVSGSYDGFIAEMNANARRLGMRRSYWVNPHGLPNDAQVTTARDLAILARALLAEFPDRTDLYRIGAISLGGKVIRNHNHLLERFPGSDGMKTGFICSAGFNVVASATRGGEKLIAVVLGAPSARERAEVAAELFTRAFAHESGGLFQLSSNGPRLDQMPTGPEASLGPANLRQEVCSAKRRQPVAEDAEETFEVKRFVPVNTGGESGMEINPQFAGTQTVRVRRTVAERPSYLSPTRLALGPPVPVWIGGADAAPPTAVAARTAPVDAPLPEPAPGRLAAPATPPAGESRPTVALASPQQASLFPASGQPFQLATRPDPAAATPAATVPPAAAATRPGLTPIAVPLPTPKPRVRSAQAGGPTRPAAPAVKATTPPKKPVVPAAAAPKKPEQPKRTGG